MKIRLVNCYLIALIFSTSSVTYGAPQHNYEDLTASEKLQVLEQLQWQTEYDQLPEWKGTEPLLLLGMALPFQQKRRVEYMGVSVNRESDYMPQGRSKPIHTYGSTGSVRFVVENQLGYTGVFSSGADYGVARLSLAAKPSRSGMTPGLAVKFLIDGQPSVNLQVMQSLDGQSSYNFFENTFTNIIAEPKSTALKLMMPVFKAVSKSPLALGLKHMAAIDSYGVRVTPVANINFPAQIYLVPTGDLRFESFQHEVRDDLNSIEVGTRLYDVWVSKTPGGKLDFLGYIHTTSPFLSSSFSDENLFFKHQRIEDDTN